MFTLKKLITPFIIPPGLFVLILLVGAIVLQRRRKRAAGLFCMLMAAMIWVFATVPMADLVVAGLEERSTIPSQPQGDVIIMLGGGMYPGVRDMSGIGAPGFGTMERLVTAARLHRRLGVPIIVSGGTVFKNGGNIAEVGARFLMDLGIPAEMILSEDSSRDTYENAIYSKELCRLRSFKHPLLVTSAMHMPRALFCFEKAGLRVTPYPCGLTLWEERPSHWSDYLPTAANLEITAAGLHERLGMLYYRVRY